MAFKSGRVSFTRFLLPGEPADSTEKLLETLNEHAFTEHEIGRPDEVESGWVTGEHLFDTQFDYVKNVFGPTVHIGLRIDTHRVPADVKRAYKQMNEQAAAEDNPSGHSTRSQRQEAKDLAERQMNEELASGRYRRSRMVPVLWHLPSSTLYLNSTSNNVAEILGKLFRDTFGVTPEPLSAGTMAGEILHQQGRDRDFEDVRPSSFTPPPGGLEDRYGDDGPPGDSSRPMVPWSMAGAETKDFLGNEFLIWWWFLCDTGEGMINVETDSGDRELAIALDKTLDLDCAWNVTGRTTIRSDGPTRLPEARDALGEGKWPRKAGVLLADGADQWELTLHADGYQVSSASIPPAVDPEGPRDEAEHRILSTRNLAECLDGLYREFLGQRMGSQWPTIRKEISAWIQRRRPGHS
ncbi:MAG: recombination-associated protein RdgC [Phycisphaeraceae bacterium]|nr:recombination-associated protein RdgC [Phycisphaeraceae bacterium]